MPKITAYIEDDLEAMRDEGRWIRNGLAALGAMLARYAAFDQFVADSEEESNDHA